MITSLLQETLLWLHKMCQRHMKTEMIVKTWPYCVLAVSIDELQQKALKLLQGRLEGNGQFIQSEGRHLEQLRPQQSVS